MSWRDEAACRGKDPEQFFPFQETPRKLITAARSVCLECPVRFPCGADAQRLDERFALRAGFVLSRPRERDALREMLDGVVRQPVEELSLPCEECGTPTRDKGGVCWGCKRGMALAAPVRAHIHALRAAGRTAAEIGRDAGGIGKDTILSVGSTAKPSTYMDRAVAEAIKAVPL